MVPSEGFNRIKQMETPKDRRDVRKLLGILMYYIDIIPNIRQDLATLQELVKTSKEYKWLKMHQDAFENIKECLDSPYFTILPNYSEDGNRMKKKLEPLTKPYLESDTISKQ